ncbi:diacylglycerol kinase family protein [Pedobacter montanisoli]|uniref:Diacylglycerol kinase family protein n=1 Tax=Pedobacter montanisoli TaxID=2923277 RepID=A0ABS9ZRI2_9SPHI|nr:diacylglycerol kinase family protein [Pedobacter montanisoli]MCJ0741195.1 diacylglycerol kinase family protein [Pedobacter montanisoli]
MAKFLKGFIYAGKGIAYALQTQLNFKLQLIAALIVVLLGLFLKLSVLEWVAVLVCMGLVMALELINTSIELLVDKISPEYDPVAGKIKDVAAGAVLIAAIVSFIVALLIFVPKFF